MKKIYIHLVFAFVCTEKNGNIVHTNLKHLYMKYFFDTEFHEYKKKPLFCKPIDTIELISIGIVSELGSKYYAICKEFDVKAAWNNYQWKDFPSAHGEKLFQKEYWLRENVLKPIFVELLCKERVFLRVLWNNKDRNKDIELLINKEFSYSNFKSLLKKYGKSKAQIADEVHMFCSGGYFEGTGLDYKERIKYEINPQLAPEFYAYYADYDWVVFCWLFGRMIDLPKGFPMYCKDLKQMLDEKIKDRYDDSGMGKSHLLGALKDMPNYPKQTNEHNALSDAEWNLRLYKFLKNL